MNNLAKRETHLQLIRELSLTLRYLKQQAIPPVPHTYLMFLTRDALHKAVDQYEEFEKTLFHGMPWSSQQTDQVKTLLTKSGERGDFPLQQYLISRFALHVRRTRGSILSRARKCGIRAHDRWPGKESTGP